MLRLSLHLMLPQPWGATEKELHTILALISSLYALRSWL